MDDLALVRCACHPMELKKHDRTRKCAMRDLKVEDVADALVMVGVIGWLTP